VLVEEVESQGLTEVLVFALNLQELQGLTETLVLVLVLNLQGLTEVLVLVLVLVDEVEPQGLTQVFPQRIGLTVHPAYP
jgi:hypothetical protein